MPNNGEFQAKKKEKKFKINYGGSHLRVVDAT